MMGMDLMSAGSDTTSTTLLWTVIYLVLNPEVQERCYQEINEHLGAATVSLTDMSKLQFCQASIAEIQRVSVVAISGIQHRVTKTVGYESDFLISSPNPPDYIANRTCCAR